MKFDDTHPDYFEAQPEQTPQRPSIDFGTDTDNTDAPNNAGTPAPTKPRHRMRRLLAWVIAVAVVVLGVTVYLRYFNPYITDAQMKCYVIGVEKRGVIFKTYEADVVSESALTDTTRLYSQQLSLSVDNDRLAQELQQVQGSGRPVTITYRVYSATVPWRGASKSVITAARFTND